MALDKIVLIANPGSASRKYALFKGSKKLWDIHFELKDRVVVYKTSSMKRAAPAGISHMAFAATVLPKIIIEETDISVLEALHGVGIRVVAPSTFFQRDHVLTKSVVKRLERLEPIAPLHIGATLAEYRLLVKMLPKCRFIAVSDSKFLASKPPKAMLYGLPYRDSNALDIKRFGYHGLSLESTVLQLKEHKLLSKRMAICHLGGGSSVVALNNGKVIESTMGFSPLEGLIMTTRSGNVDLLAYKTLKKAKRMTPQHVLEYFNNQSGLLGVSGISSDVRQLLTKEKTHERAALALEMYVYQVQQAVGAMAASMNGIDGLIFTGTIGERSAEIRRRITSNLMFLGLKLDLAKNRQSPLLSDEPSVISKQKHTGAIIVVYADEAAQMARCVAKMI